MRDLKNHFIAGFAPTDPDLPVNKWDCLIDQAVIPFNLLQNYQANPNLPAYAYKFCQYNFNR